MPDIQAYYEDYWKDPDSYNDPTTPDRQMLLQKFLAGLPRGSRILDAGCGRGEFVEFLCNLGFAAEGFDISSAVIEHARSRYPEQVFHHGEMEALVSKRAGDFDGVFSSEVVEHLFDVVEYLKSAHALLKPSGVLILTTPYHGLIKNLAMDIFNYDRHYDPTGQHIRFFNRKSLMRCLTEGGFRIEHLTGYGRPWPFWKSFFVVAKRV